MRSPAQINRTAPRKPTQPAVLGLTALALSAFAANSILARLALTETGIDPVSFTTLRIVSGAVVLWLIVRARAPAVESRSIGSINPLFAELQQYPAPCPAGV